MEYDKNVFAKNLRYFMALREITATDITRYLSVSKASVSDWCNGKKMPRMDKIEKLASIFSVQKSDLIEQHRGLHPVVTEDFETFPVIGDLAAGYDHIAAEDWTGETINIPKSYLRGRGRDEFIVLSVSGDSMYPMYQDGDKVLILRQEIQPDHGQVCAVLYKDELSTLKKVSWGYGGVILEPINPMYQPIEIKGEDLAHFRVIGVPRLLIREIDE